MYHKEYKELEVLKLYLDDYRKRLYLREICKMTKISLRTTQRILEDLEKARIMKSETKGKNKYFYMNLENIETKNLIIQTELQKTLYFLKKYPVFKTFSKEIKDETSLIAVFGSFAKFKADKDSDVDILIVSDTDIELPSHLLPNKLHKIMLSKSGFFNAVDRNETMIKKILESHVILNNHSFFINVIWGKYA